MLSLLLSCLFHTTESVPTSLASGMLCCRHVVSAIRLTSLVMLSLSHLFPSRHALCSDLAHYAILTTLRYHRHRHCSSLSLSYPSVTNSSSPSITAHYLPRQSADIPSLPKHVQKHLGAKRHPPFRRSHLPHTVGTLAAPER